MTDDPRNGDEGKCGGATLLKFPQSRVPGKNKTHPIKILGLTPLAQQLGGPEAPGAHGHWCSHCQGIWFGRPGEVQCPVCANRHG